MAEYLKFDFVVVFLVIFQIFLVGGCPARCVKNGGTCSFLEPTKCCTPICLAQYQVCGKTCAALNAACVLSNDCCVPLSCENNVCCSGALLGGTCNTGLECCSKSCHSIRKVCCNTVNIPCNSNGECCSNNCNQSTKVCDCNIVGDICLIDEDCCNSFICNANICDNP